MTILIEENLRSTSSFDEFNVDPAEKIADRNRKLLSERKPLSWVVIGAVEAPTDIQRFLTTYRETRNTSRALDYRYTMLQCMERADNCYKAPGTSNNPALAYTENVRADRDRLQMLVISMAGFLQRDDPELAAALMRFARPRD